MLSVTPHEVVGLFQCLGLLSTDFTDVEISKVNIYKLIWSNGNTKRLITVVLYNVRGFH